MVRRAIAVATAIAAALAAAAPHVAAGEAPPEPSGYRLEDYRAPVPATLSGATVIDVAAAERLWREGRAAFVDVLPRAPRPANLPSGTIWRDRPRANIPGSIWLANVGYGVLSPETEAYFRDRLESATGGDRARALVFYCQENCWMSWNAAKRALSWGYRHVFWFPAGTDGWEAAGLPLVPAEPLP